MQWRWIPRLLVGLLVLLQTACPMRATSPRDTTVQSPQDGNGNGGPG